MKLVKTVGLIFLAFVLVFTSISANVYAEGPEQKTIYPIMDFSAGIPDYVAVTSEEGVISLNNDQDYTYDGAETSVKIDFSTMTTGTELAINFAESDMGTNFSPFVASHLLKIRAYVENGTYVSEGQTLTSQMSVIWCQTGTLAGSQYPYYIRSKHPVNRDSDGASKDGQWIELTFDFSLFGPTTQTIDWSEIEGFKINLGSWTTTPMPFGAPTEFYIDSVWLEGPPVMIPADNSDNYMIMEFNSSNLGYNPVSTKKSDINARLYNSTARLEISGGGGSTSLIVNRSTPLDTTQYNYLNMWVYSPEVLTGKHVNACVYKFDLSGYYRKRVYLNWEGWKLISLQLTEDEFTHTQTGDWSNVGIVGIYVGGYGSPAFDEDTYLNVDMIWLSKEKPSGFSLLSNSATGAYVDSSIEIPFNNQLAYLRDDVVTIEKDGGDIITSGYTTSVKDNKLILTFETPLENSTTYTAKINNKLYDISGQTLLTPATGIEPDEGAETTFTFATEEKTGFRIKPILFKGKDDSTLLTMPKSGDLTAEVGMANWLSEGKDAVLILAIYNLDGELVEVKQSQAATLETDDIVTLKATISKSNFEGYYAKAFLWNTLSGIKPYINSETIN